MTTPVLVRLADMVILRESAPETSPAAGGRLLAYAAPADRLHPDGVWTTAPREGPVEVHPHKAAAVARLRAIGGLPQTAPGGAGEAAGPLQGCSGPAAASQ